MREKWEVVYNRAPNQLVWVQPPIWKSHEIKNRTQEQLKFLLPIYIIYLTINNMDKVKFMDF